MADEWKNPTGKLCVCGRRGKWEGWGTWAGSGWFSRIIKGSEHLWWNFIWSCPQPWNMVCRLQPACSLCGIYLHILSLSSPDCCSRLTAKMTTKINQEIFRWKIRKEWRQMGTFRNSKKNIAYWLLQLFQICFYIYIFSPLASCLSSNCFHFGIRACMFGQHLTNSSLLLKDIPTSEIFFIHIS